MDPSLLDLPIQPDFPQGAAGAPAGLPPAGVPVVQYTPPPSVAPQPAPVTPGTTAPLPPPPAQPQFAAPVPPVPPTKSVTDRESTTTTSRTKIAPEERAAQAQLDKDAQQAQEIARKRGDLAAQEADAQAQAAQRKQDILQQHGEKLNNLVQTADTEWNKANDRYQQAFDAARNEKPKDFWGYDDNGKARTDTGQRQFWAGIAMALGGFSQSRTGHNTGYDMIRDAIERRDRMEKDRIARMREDRDKMDRERDVVLQRKHEKISDLTAQKAAAYDLAASELESRLAAMGRPKAEIETNADVLKLRQKRDEENAQWKQATRTEIKNQVVTKTQQIVGGPDAAGAGGRAAGKMMEYGLMGTSIADGIKKLNGLPIPSPEELQQVQRNDQKLKAIQDSHGTLGMLGAAISQKTGLAPYSRFKGVSEKTAEWVRNQELVADKVAEVLGADKESKENFRRNLIWGADDTKEGIRKKISQSQEFGQKAINLARQYGGVAETGQPGIIPPGQASVPAAQPAQGETKQVRNKKTGEVVTVRVGPDGRYYPVDVAAR